jgi:hypothetical protein
MNERRHFSLMRFIARARFLSERRRLELFPPFWLMRIKVLELSEDWRTVRIRLPLTMLARNGGGGMFGGFQAALADPIPALSCLRVFPGYAVWTRRPALEASIRSELAKTGRSTPEFEFAYHLANGRVCTVVHNTVAIRPRGYRKD